MLFRRSLMMSEQSKSGYIKSGLIAMYDGLNNTRLGHNSNPDKWEDLSGNGNDLTLQDITFDSDKAILKGNYNQIAYCDNAIEPVITAEIVFTITTIKYSWIFEFNKSAGKILATTSDCKGLVISHPVRQKFLFANSIINALSIDYLNQSLLCNGKVLESIAFNDTWRSRAIHNIQVGSYSGGSGFNPVCKIYSIRLYNRELTDEERLHNYQIDSKRFLS